MTAETPLIPQATAASLPLHYKGANMGSGATNYTYSDGYGNTFQGKGIFSPHSRYDYLFSKGLRTVRLLIDLGDLQPTANSPLDASYMAHITDAVEYTRSKGMYIIIDPHDYGYNQLGLIGVDSGTVPAFADFWTRVATVYQNYPNVLYGLMNEPHAQTAAQWQTGALAAINAIRSVTATQTILIPSTSYTSASDWINNGSGDLWAGYTDPVGGPFMFEVHQYLNQNNNDTQSVCITNAYQRLQAFTAWARSHGFKAMLAEFNWCPANFSSPTKDVGSTPTYTASDVEGPKWLTFLDQNADVFLGWTWFWGGDGVPSTYGPCLNQNGDGSDTEMMTMLVQHLGNTIVDLSSYSAFISHRGAARNAPLTSLLSTVPDLASYLALAGHQGRYAASPLLSLKAS